MINYIKKNHLVKSSVLPEQQDYLSKGTKADLIMKKLLSGKRVSKLEAIYVHNVFCLAQVITYLRKSKNLPVITKMLNHVDSFGVNVRYAEYYLDLEVIAEIKAKGVF